MSDAFYTPTSLANIMCMNVIYKEPSIIADFSVGNGELLCAAYKIWNRAKYVATDIDGGVLNSLNEKHPNWTTEKCDFIDPISRSSCSILNQIIGKVSVILLNPPFSCRGGKKWNVDHDGIFFSCSTAMAFIINSIDYLCPNGELLAILPSGSISSEKDHKVWQYLKNRYSVSFIQEQGNKTFTGCYPNTIMIKLVKNSSLANNESINPDVKLTTSNISRITQVKIIRGTVQMHDIQKPNLSRYLKGISKNTNEKVRI